MLELAVKTQFKKDLKRMQKRGKNPEKLWRLVDMILTGGTLAEKHRHHKLSGNYSDFWECHIEPDWLLIHLLTETTLTLVRTGTHADVF